MPAWLVIKRAQARPQKLSWSTNMARLRSGLQRDVMNCYRLLLRAAWGKPAETQAGFVAMIRADFRKHSYGPTAIPKGAKSISKIEYLVRKGKKQLTLLQNPSLKKAS